MVAVEGHAARDAGRRPDFQAQDRGVLGGLAHAGARRRVPPGPFVDGIWLAERLVVPICCSEDRVVSWYMAQLIMSI